MPYSTEEAYRRPSPVIQTIYAASLVELVMKVLWEKEYGWKPCIPSGYEIILEELKAPLYTTKMEKKC